MGFHVGQLVVCVDDKPKGGYPDEPWPVVGRIYTVRALRWSDWYSAEQVLLVEIVCSPRLYNDGTYEAGYNATRFRPLDESRLTVFRQMLVSPPTKELVEDHLDASIADCERAVREALGF